MLLSFLHSLHKKPNDYQLMWLFILGQIDDNKVVELPIKSIRKRFNYKYHHFYRILMYGIGYFNGNNKGVYMHIENRILYLRVNRVKKPLSNDKHISREQNSKVKKATKVSNENNKEIYKLIIDYLNEKTGKKFTIKNKQTINSINGRLKDGFGIDDFKRVIDIKCSKWLNTDMADYLRPITLFSQKFESYLNEVENPNKNVSKRFTSTQQAVNKAKEINWFSEEEQQQE